MPSLDHESLVLLFRNQPELAAQLLREALHVELPAYTEARLASSDLTEVVPTEFRRRCRRALRRRQARAPSHRRSSALPRRAKALQLGGIPNRAAGPSRVPGRATRRHPRPRGGSLGRRSRQARPPLLLRGGFFGGALGGR